jgi:copper chaperone CopZ
MKPLKIIALITILFSTLTGCEAKINNAKTETYKVWGNCGMCQETIEKAVKQKNIAKGKWNQKTKMITITYDYTKTNSDAILKRIAQVGYDNDKYTAPNEVYNQRPKCCQYKRK